MFLFLDYYEPEIDLDEENQGEFSQVDLKREDEIWVQSPYLDQKLPTHKSSSNDKRAPKYTFPKLMAEALFKVPLVYDVIIFIAQNLI